MVGRNMSKAEVATSPLLYSLRRYSMVFIRKRLLQAGLSTPIRKYITVFANSSTKRVCVGPSEKRMLTSLIE